MIFAHSIISGYVTLQGSATVHLPMFFAMMLFVTPLPNNEDLNTAFSEEDLPWRVEDWFVFAAFMHVILSLVHISTLLPDSLDDEYPSTFRSLQLFSVLLETINLCWMMKLYGLSMTNNLKLTDEVRMFQFWILCEIFVALSTITTTMMYLLVRAAICAN